MAHLPIQAPLVWSPLDRDVPAVTVALRTPFQLVAYHEARTNLEPAWA